MEEWLDELNEYARLGSMRAFEHIAKELRSKGYKCIQRVENGPNLYDIYESNGHKLQILANGFITEY